MLVTFLSHWEKRVSITLLFHQCKSTLEEGGEFPAGVGELRSWFKQSDSNVLLLRGNLCKKCFLDKSLVEVDLVFLRIQSQFILLCAYLHPIANPKDGLSYSEYGRVEPGSIFRIHRCWTS